MFNNLTVQAESPVTIRRMTIRERLEQRKAGCELELQNINEALNLMDTTPDFEKIHDAITKAGY